jgi:hypothetical protein
MLENLAAILGSGASAVGSWLEEHPAALSPPSEQNVRDAVGEVPGNDPAGLSGMGYTAPIVAPGVFTDERCLLLRQLGVHAMGGNAAAFLLKKISRDSHRHGALRASLALSHERKATPVIVQLTLAAAHATAPSGATASKEKFHTYPVEGHSPGWHQDGACVSAELRCCAANIAGTTAFTVGHQRNTGPTTKQPSNGIVAVFGAAGTLSTSVGLPTIHQRSTENTVFHAGFGDDGSPTTMEKPAGAWNTVRIKRV